MSARASHRRGNSSLFPALVALVLGAVGCLGSATPEVRPRIGPPAERVPRAFVPSNADIRVDCDFEDIGGTRFGYVQLGARVRCPKDDIERYLGASGFASGPHEDDAPEVEVRIRFDPGATPRMSACPGNPEGIPIPVPVLNRLDRRGVAYSSPEIGTFVEIRIKDDEAGDRYLTGRGYAGGVECGDAEFLSVAESSFLAKVGQRIAEASLGALDAAILGKVQARPTAQAIPPPPQLYSSALSPQALARPSKDPVFPDFGRYSALVIGIDRYENLPALGNAVRDAEAVGALLREEYGYDVVELRNPKRAEILKTLVAFRQRLEAQDNLLIYYAGHGWLDEEADEGYWLPADAEREDPTHWISNDTITAQLRALRAKHVMVVADSCYSGKLVRGIRVGAKPSDYLARMASRRARVVMSSGGLEPVSDAGGRAGHSVFAAAFLEALRGNQDVVDGATVFSQIRRPVMTNADQIPEYADIRKAGHDGGDFLFVRPSARQAVGIEGP